MRFCFPVCNGNQTSCCYVIVAVAFRVSLRSQSLERDGRISEFYRRRQFCETLAGNPCDVITVTAPSDDPEELASRRGVFVSARVHPGETNSSWMMQVCVYECVCA